MDFPIQINNTNKESISSGHRSEVSIYMLDVLANNVDPDAMLHSATFYLGLHCLSK